MRKLLHCSILLVTTLLFSARSYASHIYGADFFYTYVSGNTYTITLVVYGDCNINFGSTFLTLSSASPQVQIFNGSTLSNTVSLFVQNPSSGTEVTPVCASQLNNTTCVSTTGTVPGVKKFTYSANVTLSASANWKFVFDGNLTTAQAGRSNSITNIVFPPPSNSTTIRLEATLNNSSAQNSSPVYTTIPTPFFCINKAASYNPGTVDPNNDNLVYNLVPGLDASTGSAVGYVTGYSATAPLAASTGTFSFSTTTGQLNFTPNATQRSLVVTKVEEYRGTTLVGTSMREMTYVVLNNCNNNPPLGNISNLSTGTLVDTVTVKVCQSAGNFTFNINPTDPDNDTINVQASGLPTGATFNVTGNNTTAPSGLFSWNVNSVAPGLYNFFVTYTDNGCPLSSKQTMAYTIKVLPRPSLTYQVLLPASCVRKAKFLVTPTDTFSPWTISVLQGTSVLHNFPNVTSQVDSLDPGTYTLRVTNTNGCFKDTSIIIDPPPPIVPTFVMKRPTCFNGSDGGITVTAAGAGPPFQYAFGSGSYSSANVFTGLTPGNYTIHIKDTNFCIKDTTVLLPDTSQISANVTLVEPPCNFFNSGVITISGIKGTAPYQYALGSGSFSTTNTFSGLFSGSYTIHIKDANNCTRDTVIVLPDQISVHANAVVTDVLCHGASTGAITLTAFAATSPYKYQLGSGPLTATNTFTSLPAGMHNFHIEDANKCYLDTTVEIKEPTAITVPSTVSNISCFGQVDGTISISGSGGVPPYTFAMGAGAFGSVTSYTGLAKGPYTLRVKDANGCIKDTIITIIEPAVLGISRVQITQPKCNGSVDGSLTVTPSGGTSPFTYALDAGTFGSSNVLNNIYAGTFTIHVKDVRGCAKDTVVSVSEPTPLQVTAQVKQSTCSTLANGMVTLAGSGATPGYTYAINSGAYSTNPVITPIAAGTHILHVKDKNNCIKDTIIAIIDSLAIIPNLTVTDVTCFGLGNGSVLASPSGAAAPYTFALGSGAFGTNALFTPLIPGTYKIRIKDVNGCLKDTNINIVQPTQLGLTATATDILCNGAQTGVVNIAGNGGTTPYTFANGTGPYGTSGTINFLKAGKYTFHVKDNRNCIKDTTITLTEPPALAVQLEVTDVLCYGTKSGKIVVNASGGVPGYSYWADNTPAKTSNVLDNLGVGTRAVHIKDANGCLKDTFVYLNTAPPFNMTGVSFENPKCKTTSDGSVTLDGNGGTPPYTYGYINGTTGSGNTVGGIPEGTYTFFIRDANNCTLDTVITLTGLSDLGIAAAELRNASCFGYADGAVGIITSGGFSPFTYRLNGVPRSESVMTELPAGKYTVSVSDSFNCTLDTSLVVTQPEKLVVKAKVVSNNDCESYDNGGQIATDVIGGTLPYAYAWNTNPPRYFSEVSGLGNGTYMVTVKDANNCSDSTSEKIIYDNCCKVIIPDAFTPNNDGRNDRARVLFKGDLTLKVFSIYNRFGQIMFTTTNVADGWDGMWNGIPQDLGTYNYYMKGICGNGGTKEVEYKGTITLIR